MTSADDIRKGRQARGMTQDDLAKALSVSLRSVARWETGDAVPRDTLMPELERVLGITPATPRFIPSLPGASDAELFAEVARRAADKDRTIIGLSAEIERLRPPSP